MLSILWAWRSSAGREWQRATLRRRGNQWPSTCNTASRLLLPRQRKWREGWRGYFTGVPFERQRKIGEWKKRVVEKRVVIERKDLFDITRKNGWDKRQMKRGL